MTTQPPHDDEIRSVSDESDADEYAVLRDPARLAAIARAGLDRGGPNGAFDEIITMTREAMGASNVAINIVSDTERSCIAVTSDAGATTTSMPVENSLCVFPVISGKPLIIDDVSEQDVLADHPAVAGGNVGAYLGFPLADVQGYAVGTLCTWHKTPHHWSSGEVQILSNLADVLREIMFGPDVVN